VFTLHPGHLLSPLIALLVFFFLQHFTLCLNTTLFLFKDSDFVTPVFTFKLTHLEVVFDVLDLRGDFSVGVIRARAVDDLVIALLFV
jgi:hypothetical protein